MGFIFNESMKIEKIKIVGAVCDLSAKSKDNLAHFGRIGCAF